MKSILEISKLNKQYKKSDFQLTDISLTIQPGEVIGLIGKNGSGKSTLINTIVGNRFKTSGDIKFFGDSISENDSHYKEQIGVVFDDLRVPNKLTITEIDKVFSNVYTTWNSEQFFSIINDFELPTNQLINTFSRGMRMKTALAISLAHNSKLLILDEATAGMDASGREEVIEILQDFVARENGIMISSHISEDIEQLATKLVFMRDGKIVLTEDKHLLLQNYGVIEQNVEDFNIPNDILVASRTHNNKRISLVNDKSRLTDTMPIQNIDEATKILMRGDK